MTGRHTLALWRVTRHRALNERLRDRAFLDSLCWVICRDGTALQVNIRAGSYAAVAAARNDVLRIEDSDGNQLWPPALKVVA